MLYLQYIFVLECILNFVTKWAMKFSVRYHTDNLLYYDVSFKGSFFCERIESHLENPIILAS